jgi:hypothetical protein
VFASCTDKVPALRTTNPIGGLPWVTIGAGCIDLELLIDNEGWQIEDAAILSLLAKTPK